MNENAFHIRHTLQPGDLGAIVQLHGIVYAREYGLDTTFEPYVAKPLSDFVLEGSGRLWVAERNGQLMGSIAVVESEGEGQLRWFLLVPQARGSGLGKRLLDLAMDYCRERRFPRVFLWSFSDLTAALKLYERAGFSVTETVTEYVWGAQRAQVRMDLELSQG
jgi:ribosomal protein S18 acetylase RimI-like enzyme